MRILFLSHYFPPEGNAPASRTYENCKRWVREGHDVTVVTCAPNSPHGTLYDGYRNRLSQEERVDGIRVVRVWTYLAANKGTLKRILNFVSYMVSATLRSIFLRRPDVVIATSPQFFCGWAGWFVSVLKWRRFILEIRDLWPETISAIGAMRGGLLIRFLEILEHWMYRGATHIVTVGEGYREKLLEKGVPAEKISIVTNGADLEFFSPRTPDADLCKEYDLEGKFVCASVGTLGLCHGLEVVPRAAKHLQDKGRGDICFMLVGDGAVRGELEAMSKELELRNLIFTGRQDKTQIPAFLSITDACLAHLQRQDLFKTVLPSKIFEAMAMRRPIILGVEGHAAAVVERAGAGICIEPENPQELADAVERLADDPGLRQEFGRSGQEYVEEHFDREKLALTYLGVIEKIVEKR